MRESEKVNDAEAVGSGEGSARDESGVPRITAAKMQARAIEQGWITGRWQTDTPKAQIIEQIRSRGDITLKERALIAAFELVESDKPRQKGIGVRNVVAMERQNQIDTLHAVRSGNDPAVQTPVTRTPDQVVNAMDDSIPFVPEKEAV